MPLHPNLSYSVTRVEAPTLNNAGDFRENPIIRGAVLELRVHKWHKDVRLKKAWTTVPELGPGVFFDFTKYAVEPFSVTSEAVWASMSAEQRAAAMNSGLPGSMTYNPAGVIGEYDDGGLHLITLEMAQASHAYLPVDAEQYILFRMMLGSDVLEEQTLTDLIIGKFPNITAHRDPPIRNIFHITTTNGSHTPITYRHDNSVVGTDNPTGLVYERSMQDRPGGQQLKFSLWLSQEIYGEVLLDGYPAADPRYPIIYPVYVTGEAESDAELGEEVTDIDGETRQRAKTKMRLRQGDPISKKMYGVMKRKYTEPPGATNTLETPP